MKKYLLLVAAVAALVSCTSDFIQPEVPEQEIPEQGQDAPEVENLQEVLIYANAPKSGSDQSEESSSQEQELPETRTQLVNGTDVRWSAGDVVKVCFPAFRGSTSYKRWYQVTELFTSVGADGDEKMVFKGNWNTSAECGSSGVIFYPQSVEYSSQYNTYDWNGSTTIAYTIPDVQTAVDNSFAPNLNLSYAFVTKTAMDNNEVSVSFKNLCGLVKVKLPEEDYDIVSITLESTNTGAGGYLCGKANLSINSRNEMEYSYPTAAPIITLQREDGSELTPGASYYAVVWPKDHSSIKFTFTDVNGDEAVKESPANSNHVFAAGTITSFNISSLNFDVAPYLNVGATSLSVPARGATNSFIVVANNPVSVSSPSNGWLSVTYDGSQVTAVAAANEGVTERTATITITSAGETKTVTVTQPPVYYKRGAVVDDVRNLNEDDSYMIFNTNTNWVETDECWKLMDGSGNLSATSFNDGKITADQLFKFKKSSSSVASNWKDYSEVIVGSLYSPYNSYYLTTTFRFEGSGSGITFIFASSWGGASSNDIDIWNYNNTNQTLKWSNGLAWGSNDGQGSSARKFYIYKVSVTE